MRTIRMNSDSYSGMPIPNFSVSAVLPQLGGQTVAIAVEQQQRVIASRFETPVVSARLRLAIDQDLSAIHIRHYPLRQNHSFCPGDQIPVMASRPSKVASWVNNCVSNDWSRDDAKGPDLGVSWVYEMRALLPADSQKLNDRSHDQALCMFARCEQ